MNSNQIAIEIKKPDNFDLINITKFEIEQNYITFYLDIPDQISFAQIYLYFFNQKNLILANWDEETEFDFFTVKKYIFTFRISDNLSNNYKSYNLLNAIFDEFGFDKNIINNYYNI